MKLSGHVEKWASGVLGAVSLVLLVNLVLQFSGVRAGNSRPSVPPTAAAPRGIREVAMRSSDELARYDPVVRLDLLKEFEERPLPEIARDPFAFKPLPAAPPSSAAVGGIAPTGAAPPPPAPIPLKALGYAEKAGGVREAYVSDDEQVYVVHEGDSIAQRYKILKIAPSVVTVQDVSSQQTADLPIPQ